MQVIFKVELFDLSSFGALRPRPEDQISVTINGFQSALDLLEGLSKTASFLVNDDMTDHCAALITKAKSKGYSVKTIKTEPRQSIKEFWWYKLPIDLHLALYKRFLAKKAIPVWILTETIFNKPYNLPSNIGQLAGTRIIKRLANILTR